MTKIYEVDRNADALIILSGSDHDAHHHHDTSRSSAKKVNGHVNGVTNGETEKVGESHEILRLKVSSKHLALASEHFRNKFGRNGESFTTTESDGRIHFRLENYDPTAVTTVMNIIHSRGRRVPKSIDLDSLTKVATFVEKYKFDEAVEAYSDRWIHALSGLIPSSYSEKTVQWLHIANVFQHPDLFRRTTRLAITRSPGPISEQGSKLNIPEDLIKNIDSKRQGLISEVHNFLRDLVDELQKGKTPCTNGCDTFLLGVLVKALHNWKLVKPYTGISFESLTKAVRDIQDEVWYTGPHPTILLGTEAAEEKSRPSHGRKNRFGAHHCGIRSLINPKLYALEVSLQGLNLKSKF